MFNCSIPLLNFLFLWSDIIYNKIMKLYNTCFPQMMSFVCLNLLYYYYAIAYRKHFLRKMLLNFKNIFSLYWTSCRVNLLQTDVTISIQLLDQYATFYPHIWVAYHKNLDHLRPSISRLWSSVKCRSTLSVVLTQNVNVPFSQSTHSVNYVLES